MDVGEAIKKAKYNLSDLSIDESGVKQYVIMPLLHSLGWDIYDRNEVKPEYRTSKGFVDYALFINDRVVAFLEIKKPSENLYYHEDQLLRYAYSEGVRLACLTNGKEWWFYLPLEEGKWEDRKFLEVNIYDSKFQSAIEDILSKESIFTGKSQRRAKSMLYMVSRLPEVFVSILREPDDSIVELIKERFSEQYNVDLDDSYLSNFLKGIADELYKAKHTDSHYVEPQHTQATSRSQSSWTKSKSRKVKKFVLQLHDGSPHTFGAISNLVVFLFNHIEKKHPGFFERFYKEKHGTKRKYISKDKSELYHNRPDLSESQNKELINGWYIGTNYNVESFKRMILLACRVENIKCNLEENGDTLIVKVSL